MTKLLRSTWPVALAFLFGVVVNVQGQSETDAARVSDIAIDAARALSAPGEETAVDTDEIGPAPIVTHEPEPLAPPPARRLNVILDWYLTPYHAPLIVARERGLFDLEGLDVTLTTPADPTVPPKLVAAQRAQLALTSQPRLHLLVEQGLPLIRVATLVPAPLATLLVREDSDIDTLAQLKGKTVGYVLEGPARMLLDGMLKEQPFTSDDMELRRVDFALTRSLVEGEVDAVMGATRHVARRQLSQEGIAAVEFMVEENDVPLYDELILVANRDILRQHRRDIIDFLDALESATLWLVNHPEQAWELVRKAEPGLDTEANARAWPDTLRYLALRPAVLQAKRYRHFESYLHQRGLVETLTPIERLAIDLGNPR